MSNSVCINTPENDALSDPNNDLPANSLYELENVEHVIDNHVYNDLAYDNSVSEPAGLSSSNLGNYQLTSLN